MGATSSDLPWLLRLFTQLCSTSPQRMVHMEHGAILSDSSVDISGLPHRDCNIFHGVLHLPAVLNALFHTIPGYWDYKRHQSALISAIAGEVSRLPHWNNCNFFNLCMHNLIIFSRCSCSKQQNLQKHATHPRNAKVNATAREHCCAPSKFLKSKKSSIVCNRCLYWKHAFERQYLLEILSVWGRHE